MALTIFTTGNTIALTAEFSYDGLPSDLDASPTVTLYESDEVTIVGTPEIADHLEVGTYAYKVTLPGGIGSQVYYAEFAGKSAGKTIIGRSKIVASFVPA